VWAALMIRVAGRRGESVLVRTTEAATWPPGVFDALSLRGLLTNAPRARSATCPGCERECSMPVEGESERFFVVCDKRSDTGRVTVADGDLRQFRLDLDAIANFVAEEMAVNRTSVVSTIPGTVNIGTAKGKKRVQMLTLVIGDSLDLRAGTSVLPLSELVTYTEGQFRIDGDAVRKMVDSSTTANPHHTPDQSRREARRMETAALHAGWRKEFRRLQKTSPENTVVWYSQQIAKGSAGKRRSPKTIRRVLSSNPKK